MPRTSLARHTASQPALIAGLVLIAAAPFSSPQLARAAVADSAPSGFTVAFEATVPIGPDDAYKAVVDQIGTWWSPDHTWSKDSANLHIDARPGGCFCEVWPKGGVAHMTVVFTAPGKLLRMVGALGPFQQMAVTGTMTWQFSPADDAGHPGTKVQLNYALGGYADGGLDALVPVVDQVIGEQFSRYVAHVGGTPAPSPTSPAGGGSD